METKPSKEELKVQKRTARVSANIAKLESQGYHKKEAVCSIKTANIVAFVIIFIFLLISIPMYLAHSNINILELIDELFDSNHSVLFFILYLISIPVHEGIHAFWNFMFNGFDKDQIELGVMDAKNLYTPYCFGYYPLKKWQYLIMACMPAITLTIVFLLLGLWIDLPMGLFWASIQLGGGGGDFCAAFKLLFTKVSKNAIVLDHDKLCGCYVFDK